MLRLIIISIFISLQAGNVSFLGVECIPEQKIIRTFLKLNYNDFIFDYRVNINDDQSFDPSGKIDTAEVLLSKYIYEKVQICADDIRLRGKLTKIESSGEKLQVEVLYHYSKKARQIKVTNMILTDLNKDQSNLLIFKCNNFEEGVELSPEKTDYIFKIKR